MTTPTSRRAVLAGAAALPAFALPAMAAPQSDRELLALDRELEAAHARMTEAYKVSAELSDRYELIRPTAPKTPQPPAEYDELLKSMTVAEFIKLPADHPLAVWDRETEEKRVAIRAKYSEECQRLMRETGLDAAQEHAGNLAESVWKIGQRIFATQAHTIEGLKVKMRAAERMDYNCVDFEDAWASLEKDITAMAVQS